MVKKKDTLIDEAKKIKVELDELKKKAKNQSGRCKGICKKFKAKRPSNGKRYDSGQARCQICEKWIDYHGAHLKGNIPAIENSIGWFCNCCNYRMRQKPRNKIYKEKLAQDILQKEKNILRIESDVKTKTNEISSIQNQISILLHQIKYEEIEIKRYEKTGIKKLFSKISRGNKSQYEYLKTSIQKKKYGLKQLELKLKSKGPNHNTDELNISTTEKQISNKKKIIVDEIKKQQKLNACTQCEKNSHCWGNSFECNCECVSIKMGEKKNLVEKEISKNDEYYEEESDSETNQNRPKLTLKHIENFLNSKNLKNSQPYISVLKKFMKLANQFPEESISKVFENRFILGIKSTSTAKNQRSIIQNFEIFLKPQHTKMSQVISKQILDSGESTNKKQNIDEINESISEALIIIRKNSSGVYKKILEQKLMMTEEEFEKFLPKLLRIEGIVEEEDGHSNIFLKFIEKNDERVIQKQTIEQKTEYENTDWVVEKEKIQREQAPEIEKIIIQMIQNHLRWKKNINKELKRNVISEFIEVRSLEKVYEIHPSYTAERIKAHLITDLRLPKELKILENEGGLHPNLICSLAIALYATDYFHWDGKKEDEEKVTDLAISISKYLNSNNRLNNIFLDK